VYSSVPCVNMGDTPESKWLHLKVGIQCVLFLVGFLANKIAQSHIFQYWDIKPNVYRGFIKTFECIFKWLFHPSFCPQHLIELALISDPKLIKVRVFFNLLEYILQILSCPYAENTCFLGNVGSKVVSRYQVLNPNCQIASLICYDHLVIWQPLIMVNQGEGISTSRNKAYEMLSVYLRKRQVYIDLTHSKYVRCCRGTRLKTRGERWETEVGDQLALWVISKIFQW